MDRREILDTASELIDGQRARDYGDASESFGRVALIWSGVLGMKVSAAQVALCLAGLKLSRLAFTPDHADSWVDLAGYAALGGEVANMPESQVEPIASTAAHDAEVAAKTLEAVADELAVPRKLWHGEGGVSVLVDERRFEHQKLGDWLRARAAEYRKAVR